MRKRRTGHGGGQAGLTWIPAQRRVWQLWEVDRGYTRPSGCHRHEWDRLGVEGQGGEKAVAIGAERGGGGRCGVESQTYQRGQYEDESDGEEWRDRD